MLEKMPYDTRIRSLRAAFESNNLSGAILSRPQHIFYFTGVFPGSSPVFLLVAPQAILAVAPNSISNIETISYLDYNIYQGWQINLNAAAALEKALARLGWKGKKIGVELEHISAFFFPVIQKDIGDTLNLTDLLWNLRKVKDSSELAVIEKNVAGNDQVFKMIRDTLRPGLSEMDLWGSIYKTMCEQAGEPISLEADLGAGLRGANPDAKPGNVELHLGDVVFVDIYSATHGYYADTTRVFVLGEPTEKQREIHDTLFEAIKAGEKQLSAGVPANIVDAAVRGVIDRAGYDDQFPHHSGHAYGLFQQERPYLIPAEPMTLEQGMVITLEPGIYIPGWGGMRLEGNYVIEDRGTRRLDQFPCVLTSGTY